MFLIRLAFWIGLIVLLLPTDERQQAGFYATAVATVERATTFCDRNPRACATGAEYWGVFLRKAEFGARLAFDLVTNRSRKDDAAEGPAQPAAIKGKSEPKAQPPVRGTLAPSDLTPAWRAAQHRAGA